MAKDQKSRIDMNRPSVMTYHPMGVKVFMYLDAPGVYLDIVGNELPVAFAAGADFETEKMKKLAQLRLDRGLLEEAMKDALSAENRVVVEKRDKYTLISLGNGFFNIELNEGGERISNVPVNEMVARSTFDQLEPKPEPKSKAKASVKEEDEEEEAPLLFPKKESKSADTKA